MAKRKQFEMLPALIHDISTTPISVLSSELNCMFRIYNSCENEVILFVALVVD